MFKILQCDNRVQLFVSRDDGDAGDDEQDEVRTPPQHIDDIA